MGITAIGHQKAILSKIHELSDKSQSSATKLDASVSEIGLSSDDDGGSSSSMSGANRLELAVVTGDAARRGLLLKRKYPLERVQALVEDLLGFPIEINVKGNRIETQSQWLDVLSRHVSVDPMEINVTRQDPNKIRKEETTLLHGLTDACFIIDTSGLVLFQNLAAAELLGYSDSEVVGQNVRMLTPPEVRSKHDSYLKRFLETGNARIIGSGRQVQAIHKNGTEISCWLSVTEQKKASGRHTFMGTLHEIKTRDLRNGLSSQSRFAILDTLADAAMVINSQGAIQFLNVRMEKLLGYAKDVLGKNVSSIMPEPYSSNHDQYLRNFFKSGQPKIIGRGGRIVVAKHANGSVIPVHLEVDECILEGQRYFVGVMLPKDMAKMKRATLLEKTRNVVDQLAVAACVINSKGIIQAFNRPAVQVFGYGDHEVIGKNVSMLMMESDAKHHDRYISRHLETGENRIIGKFRNVAGVTKQGRSVELTLSISKSVDPDDPSNILFIGTLTAR